MRWRLDVVASPGRTAISGRRSGPDEASAGSRLGMTGEASPIGTKEEVDPVGTTGEVDSVCTTGTVDPGGGWA